MTSLGFWAPGLESHPVGLWDASENLLASVTIAAGAPPTINGFAFQSIPTVVLSANTDYVLGAFWSTPTDSVSANFFAGADPVFNGVTLIGSRDTTAGSPASASWATATMVSPGSDPI